MGDSTTWLIFLGVASLALMLPLAAVAVLVTVAVSPMSGRGQTLGGAGAGAAMVAIGTLVFVLAAPGLGGMPAGLHLAHIVFLCVPATAAGFLAGAGIGFLLRGRG